MQKLGIWAIAIAGAFVIGVLSANPVVEAVGGWKEAVDDLQNQIDNLEPSEQIYEVTAVSIIPAGEIIGNEVQLGCLEGDIFPSLNRLVTLSIDDPTIDTTNLLITKIVISVEENDELFSDFSSKLIRVDVKARHDAATQPQLFDIPVTITILCLSLSP